MPIRLPRFTWEVDCKPLGYPGIIMVFWLNPPVDDTVDEEVTDQPWTSPFYQVMSRLTDRVIIPGEFMDSGKELIIEVDTARDAYDLDHRPDFDPQILTWTRRQYSAHRQERLKAELGN